MATKLPYWVPDLPSFEILRKVDKALSDFFENYQFEDYESAEAAFFEWYGCLRPRTEFYEYLNGGRNGGETYEDGKIYLQHPENWKRSRNTTSKRRWIRTVVHEWGHYLLWSHAEEKAERYERAYASALRKAS